MIQRLSFAFLLAVLPGLVYALGLGKLELQSNLNERLEARINLISPSSDELSSLKVTLADLAAFERAGIQRATVLGKLSFEIVEPASGPDYIRISSDEPIREPFLNFLLELNWSKGRLFREYTVLLDPPIYAAKQKRLQSQAAVTPAPAAAEPARAAAPPPVTPKPPVVESKPQPIEDNAVVYNPQYTPPTPTVTSTPVPTTSFNYTGGGDIGPIQAGNTLWSIASAARPDRSVSVQQMMMALLRANPEAFINNNINGLKRGQILQMPSEADIRQLSKTEAYAEAVQQNSIWEGIAPASPATRAVGTSEDLGVSDADVAAPATGVDDGSKVDAGNEAELRLVTAGEKDEGTPTDATEPSNEKLGQELALVNESLEALKQENAELQDKLIESDTIIDDLKRLIVLKEEQLATLQQQIATSSAGEESVETEPMAENKATTEFIPPVVVNEQGEIRFANEEGAEVVATPKEEATAEMMAEDKTTAEFIPPVTVNEQGEIRFANEKVAEIETTTGDETTAESTPSVPVDEQKASEVAIDVAEDDVVAEKSFIDKMKDLVATVVPASTFSNIATLVKDNLLLIGAGLAGLLVLVLGVVSVKRRQSDQPAESSQSNYPAFDRVDSPLTTSDDDSATGFNPSFSETEAQMSAAQTEHNLSDFDAEDEEQGDVTIATPDEADDVLESTTTQAPGSSKEDDDERLSEVNVFLAYEHFDQAADFVKEAIEEQPDNLDFHSKLLEVYYAADDRKNYEEAAKVLHDKVNGKGEYWEMALAMWQELSPNRALFEASVDGNDEAQGSGKTAAGGIVNIAGDEDGTNTSTNLDFDLDATSDDTDAEVLDLTVSEDLDISLSDTYELNPPGNNQEESVETTAPIIEDKILDTSLSDSGEDASDFSIGDDDSSAGAEDDAGVEFNIHAEDDNTSSDDADDKGLDISLGGTSSLTDLHDEDSALEYSTRGTTSDEHSEIDPLDVTSSSLHANEDDEDILDVSRRNDDDLLDVTSSGSYEPEEDEDIFDITAGTGAGINKNEEIEIDDDTNADAGEENLIDFDSGVLDRSADGEDNMDLDFNLSESVDSEDDSLDFELGSDKDTESGTAPDFDVESTLELPKYSTDSENKFELDDTDPNINGGVDSDVPEIDLEFDDEDESEDENDNTVFIGRSAGVEQQSDEDEIATQLDLAKAYIELGDTDNAKTILNEVVSAGNDEQRMQAEELLAQV